MDKKVRFNAGLGFGVVMTLFMIFRGLIAEEEITTSRVLVIIFSACIGGAVAGFLFGWVMGLFANSKFVSKTTKIEIDPDESIIFETPANHFKGFESVGGRLYLTNKRLIFKSHKINIQNHKLSIELSEINQVNRYKTLRVVNNGIAITTKAGKTEKFVVEKAAEWEKHLTK